MSSAQHRLITALAGILLLVAATSSSAATITFDGQPSGTVAPGVYTEGIFDWQVISGGAWHGVGNPSPGIEALTSAGGGVISIVRNDIAGGLFTFVFSDIARFDGPDPAQILFQGFISGGLVGSDLFTTNTGFINWLSAGALNLAGVPIDELRITFDVGEMADNITLSPSAIPEPASLLLLGTGLGAIAARRRGKRQRQ